MRKIAFTHGKQISVRVLVNSLFVALLAISTTQVLGQNPSKPLPTKSQTTQPVNPIAKKLLGTWETKNPQDPSSSATLKFIFTPTGKLLIVMSPQASGKPVVYQTSYEINSKPKPMHLDVTLPENKKVQTIFEFTDDDKLKVELYESNPGKSRPTTFPEKTPLFEKISSSTALPKDTQILDPARPRNPTIKTPQNKPATGEAENNSDNSTPKK